MKIKRILIWVLVNGLFLASMYMGFVVGSDGFLNVMLFIAWLSILLTFFLFVDDVKEEMSKKGRAVPSWVNYSFDLPVALVFAYYGYIVLAVFWVIHLIIQEGFWMSVEESKEAH